MAYFNPANAYSGYSGYGAQGAQGATGLTGAQGATGTQGAQGISGYSGVKGSTGSNGAQGAQGAAGAQGATGTSGFSGTNGTNGAQGATGATGAQGAQGFQGNQGATGTAGAQGATGSTGAQGASGYSGFSGAFAGTGTSGALAVFIGASSLSAANIFQNPTTGYIGINTGGTSNAPLQVAGNVNITNGGNISAISHQVGPNGTANTQALSAAVNTLVVWGGTGGATANNAVVTFFQANVPGTTLAFLTSAGEFDATSFNSTSTRAVKTNIQPLNNSINASLVISQLSGVTYDSITYPSLTNEIGFLAEDVYPVLPSVVQIADGNPRSIDYSRVVVVLVEAVKTLQAQVAALNAKLGL